MSSKKNRIQTNADILNDIYSQAIHDRFKEISKNDNLFEKVQEAMREHGSCNLFEETEERINLSITGPELILLAQSLLLTEKPLLLNIILKTQRMKLKVKNYGQSLLKS